MTYQVAVPCSWQVVDYGQGRIETYFWDGSVCIGLPQSDEQYEATARELGYGNDTRLMCVHNDALHAFVCRRVGLPLCPVLYGSAHKRWWPWWNEEDNVVLAIQALLNGMDLPVWRTKALEQYVHWARPKTTVEELLVEARDWLDSLVEARAA